MLATFVSTGYHVENSNRSSTLCSALYLFHSLFRTAWRLPGLWKLNSVPLASGRICVTALISEPTVHREGRFFITLQITLVNIYATGFNNQKFRVSPTVNVYGLHVVVRNNSHWI